MLRNLPGAIGSGASPLLIETHEDSIGHLRMVHARVNLGVYAAGGVPFDPTRFGWGGPVENVWVPPASGYVFEYRRVERKLKVFDLAMGTEAPSLTDLSGFDVYAVITLG
jgi:hypothetical protein